MATDPICGMTVDEQSAAGTLNDAGTLYYFCSTDCLNQFAAKIEALARLKQSEVQIGTICEVHGPVVDTRRCPSNFSSAGWWRTTSACSMTSRQVRLWKAQ